MDNPGNQSGDPTAAVEDPPPPTQDSTSESSSQPRQDQQHRPPPPLSPLTGSYLLIVVGEPHSEGHKEIILQKIAKAFLSWDVAECHVNLEKELQVITGHSPEGEEARYGERLIQYATENLVTEILIHPQLNTLHQCLKNLLSSFTKHRHIIHAGYTFAGNGSWILQDGTLSISDLIEALHEPEVLRVLKAYENSVSIDVHCAPEGEWTTDRFQKEPVTKLCTIRVNPGDVMTAGNPAISAFIDYLSPFLEPANIQHLLQPTDVVGNIRFTHPTLYVFPGGQGDAALFGINGFNMLIDGGFARKACFWDFARHLDRLDAVLLTRLNNSTVNGISAVLQRKKMNHVYPQIGHFFCNLQDRKIALSPDGDKDKDSLIVNLAEEGQEIVANLRHLALKPHPCYRDGNQVDPVNLYHKVGHGKLDMYVISPARDSQAVKEFLAKWTSNDSHLFSNTGKKLPGKTFEFPLQNLVSICALLVWQPANPEDTITRILFPGSTPQHKIFEGLEKLRHLEFLKHPVCSAKSISPSVSTVTVARSLSKTRTPKPAVDNKQKETKGIIKPQAKPAKPKTEKTPPKELKSKLDNKLAEEKNELENVEEPLKKLNNRILSKDEQIENIKKEIQKMEQTENDEQKKKIVHKSKYDMRNVKSKVDSRAPSKSVDRKKLLEKKPEGETSPPGTPKKALTNGTATKAEKAKVGSKPIKAPSPTSTPAKSAKEANNRKVVESRVTTRSASKPVPKKKEDTPPPAPPAVAKTDRKPISRRPKAPPSPVKASLGKPRADPDSVSKRPGKKPEVESAVVKAVGQTIRRKLEKGAEIEKTEVGEGVEGKVEIKKLEAETTENKETDAKAVKKESESAQTGREEEEEEEDEEEEEEEEEEYLIITKEEYGEDSVKEEESGKENEEEAQTKDETEGEGEMKKLLREEEESEKKRELHDDKVEKEEETNKETEVERREPDMKVSDQRDDEGRRRPESQGEKSPERRESELQRLMEVDEGIDLKEPASKEHREGESLPEEKMSNTLETSATTAPTLPEDERIEEVVVTEDVEGGREPEEVKEVVEEKYIQEKTKEEKPEEEKEPEQPQVPTTIDVEGPPLPVVQTGQKKHPRDVVKTPDEVAELPMHEEVDPQMYSSGDYSKELQRRPDEERHEKPDFRAMIKGEANILDEEDGQDSQDLKGPPEQKIEDPVVAKYLNIIDELEKSATESKKESIEKAKEEQIEEEPERQEDLKTDGDRKPSLPQTGEADLEKTSGRTTPQRKDTSGRESPLDKERSENVSPVEAIKDASGRSTPKDSITPHKKDFSASPQEIESEVTRKQGRSVSGRSTPQDLEKETLGTSTPSKDLGEDISGKISPKDAATGEFGKLTPQVPERDAGSEPQDLEIKSYAKDIEKKISEKSSTSGKVTLEIREDENVKVFNEHNVAVDLSPSHSPESVEKEISGKSTPQELVKGISGKSTPQDLVSGKSTPQDLVKEISGKSTPQELIRETSGKSTPQELVKEISGKSTPQEIVKEISGKSTPQELVKEISGKSTPQEIVKEISGKSTPQEIIKEVSGKSTPQELIRETSGKSTPQELVKEISGKSTPQEIVKEISGKSTPQEIVKEVSGKSTPQELIRETSGKSTPQELVKEISGKSTPQEIVKEVSGKSTPQELIRETSGKSTPQELVKEISGKSTPQELVKEISGKSIPQELVKEASQMSAPQELVEEISGKSTPQDLVSGKSTPQELVKEISGKSTPQELVREISGKSTPHDLVAEVSGKSTPQNLVKEISGKSTPQELVREISGKSTPQDVLTEVSGKSTPQESVKEVTGKSTPQDLVPEVSRKSTPQELFRETSQMSTPQDLISGKSTPQELIKELSGKSTPQDLVKEIPGKSTPQELVREISDKSTPQDLVKEISGKSTPQELVKEISGKSTPQELVKEISGKSSPQELVKEISGKSTPQELVKEISGKSTPQELVKDISGKSTPQDLVIEVSGKSAPQDFVTEISGKSTPEKMATDNFKEAHSGNLLKEHFKASSPLDHRQDVSGQSSPQNLGPEKSGKSTPQEPEKLAPDDETPPHPSKDISRRSIPNDSTRPQDSVRPISGKTTPEDLSGHVSEKTTPGKEDIIAISGKTSRQESISESSDRTSPAPSSPREPGIPSQSILEGSVIAEKPGEKEQKVEESEKIDTPEVQKQSSGKATPLDRGTSIETAEDKMAEKSARKVIESSESVSSGQGEKDQSGKSTPFSTDKETSGKISPPVGGKVTSDSFSLALAEKGTSGTCSLEKQSSEKISSPSPVDISPLSLDELKEEKARRGSTSEGRVVGKSAFERVKCEEGRSSGTSTPERSHYEKSDALNGVDSDEEPEKGILESERQEKESQILDISSGEEEELKGLGEDEDSETEMRRDEVEGRSVVHGKEILKGEKDDINQLVKTGGAVETEEEQDSNHKTVVRRMLVTASSEDGGTETEICIKTGTTVVKDEASDGEDGQKDEEGEFSNLILQAQKEYNSRRSRNTSYNSSVEEAEAQKDESEEEEEEELGNLMQQAREELAFVRMKHREVQDGGSEAPQQKYETKTTTTKSVTTRMDDDHDLITITTLLTEEREEQEDGSVRVTTTKETTTTGGKSEGTITTINTTIERKDEEESSSQVTSGERWERKASQEEVIETSRRTSASSIISQEDLVSRKDSAKIEDFRQSSTEMSPLKTTYITSCGDSESLMTSSFYGNLPTEDEMIGRGEHLREFRKGRGYESVTEVGPNGERMERTYFYGGDDDPRVRRDRSRFVKTCYTEEEREEDGERSRLVHRFYASDIPEEETTEQTRIVQRFYKEETSQPDETKFRFVSEAAGEHVDFAKAVEEHVSVRGECLRKEHQEALTKYGKSKEEDKEDASEGGSKTEEGKPKDVIEGWGKPLGLPLPPKNTYKTYSFPGQNISTTSTLSTPTDNSDSVSNWGHPMNLPSPAPPPTANGAVESVPGRTPKETPKKEKKVPPNKTSGTNTPNRRSESPVKQPERRTPSTGRNNRPASSSHVYLDLTYVPHHGNSYYSNVEFFKKVRARYYVFSGTEPSKEVYNALLEAKQTWEDKKLEVTIIPTYDTDVLGYWVTENEEVLSQNKIDLSPSASRCTINLQDHETSCSAYRLEF